MWKPSLIIALSFWVVSLPTYSAAQEYLLRMGGGHTPALTYVSVFNTYFIDEVTRRVQEETGNEVRFITAWGGSAAAVDNAIETLQVGALDIVLTPIAFEQSRTPLLNYSAMVPFTTPNPVIQNRVAKRMLEEVPALQESMEPYNAHILAQMVTEAYGLATTFEWESPEDLQGRRLAMAGSNVRLFLPLGVVPLNLGIADHYQAMQTGLAGGSLFMLSGMESLRLKEVADFYTQTGFGSLSTFVAFMNTNTRQTLPPEIVEIIDEVATEAADIVAERSLTRDKELAIALDQEGVRIRSLSDTAKRQWAESLAHLPGEYAEELAQRGLPAREVIQEYIRLLGEEGYRFPVEYPL